MRIFYVNPLIFILENEINLLNKNAVYLNIIDKGLKKYFPYIFSLMPLKRIETYKTLIKNTILLFLKNYMKMALIFTRESSRYVNYSGITLLSLIKLTVNTVTAVVDM